jgi:hypothetical protein
VHGSGRDSAVAGEVLMRCDVSDGSHGSLEALTESMWSVSAVYM